jgi:hypothetical protein
MPIGGSRIDGSAKITRQFKSEIHIAIDCATGGLVSGKDRSELWADEGVCNVAMQ